MMRILVVDDEPRHRRCLTNVIKNSGREYEVLEAKSGQEALKIVNFKQINVIITDIKMPGMDGLTFISALGDRIKTIKVIILSGFASFEYAQKALNLGACDFILKPFDENNIRNILYKVEYEIEQETFEVKEKESLKQQLDEIMPEYLEHRLNQWIGGYIRGSDVDKLAGLFPYKGAGVVLLLEISEYDAYVNEYSRSELDEVKTNIKMWMSETLDSSGHTLSFFLESSENIMVTILDTHRKDFTITEKIFNELSELLYNLKKSYGSEFTIGIGSIHENIFKSVLKSYEHATKALSFKFYEGTGKVLTYLDINESSSRQNLLKYKQLDELKDAMKNCDTIRIENLVDDYFKQLKSENFLLPSQFKDIVIHMVADLLKAIQQLLCEDYYNKFMLEKIESFYECKSYDRLKKEVIDLLNHILSKYDVNKKGNKKIASLCRKYVDEHYMDDLSLEYMAGKLNLNSSYFSIFFKNNMGVKFTDYIQNIRMEKARELLEKSSKRIYEISEQVGYHDVKYFIKVFKKEFGTSPDEYRKVFKIN